MSYIEKFINDINDTHVGLGEMIATLMIASKARKFVLVVSPSGCGKSVSMKYVGKYTSHSFMPTSISIAGIANKADQFNSSNILIVIDDISNMSPYARGTTITALSQLTYEHRVQPSMQGIDFQIEDFYGSALIGVQPIILKDLMLLAEWDASIQDKALRYYHLRRPIKPNLSLPEVQMLKGIDIEHVKDFTPELNNPYWRKLIALGDAQWSRARNVEHMKDMLKATASLEKREIVIAEDYALLSNLLKPMAIENVAVKKEQLEGERYLDNNLLALLAEYYTYGKEIMLGQIAIDYKLSASQCYRIMQSQNGYWQQISKSPTIYTPSKNLLAILKTFDLERREKEDDNKNTNN